MKNSCTGSELFEAVVRNDEEAVERILSNNSCRVDPVVFLCATIEQRNLVIVRQLLPSVSNAIKLASIVHILTEPISKWTFDREREDSNAYKVTIEILKSMSHYRDIGVILDEKQRKEQQLLFGDNYWHVEFERKNIRKKLEEIGLIGLAISYGKYSIACLLYSAALDVDAGRKIQKNPEIYKDFVDNDCELYPINSPPPLLLLTRTKCSAFAQLITTDPDCVTYVQRIRMPPSFVKFLREFFDDFQPKISLNFETV
ncbi:DgyrCDS4224 [Dimorphilus gyrociliatus]|uniref:DgyrCDS4224 n=1 Tax=Dimorphilus gyrociliatus TaxID=2664684 RepID=A0A7I8VG04_9ANNE|nr:DgyrCDS4224 [Dimorphilus gyrociliatus]